jgi:hypothetical protein
MGLLDKLFRSKYILFLFFILFSVFLYLGYSPVREGIALTDMQIGGIVAGGVLVFMTIIIMLYFGARSRLSDLKQQAYANLKTDSFKIGI